MQNANTLSQTGTGHSFIKEDYPLSKHYWQTINKIKNTFLYWLIEKKNILRLGCFKNKKLARPQISRGNISNQLTQTRNIKCWLYASPKRKS